MLLAVVSVLKWLRSLKLRASIVLDLLPFELRFFSLLGRKLATSFSVVCRTSPKYARIVPGLKVFNLLSPASLTEFFA
ncbi:hypothetical protein D3C76_1703640 [compost metagenome]